MDKISSYKDLIVWQKSKDLALKCYSVTKLFPSDERFGLVPQINRAAVSVSSNIAEGWGRSTTGYYLQFLRVARGSLFELESLLIIASEMNMVTEGIQIEITSLIEEIGKMLNVLIKRIENKVAIS